MIMARYIVSISVFLNAVTAAQPANPFNLLSAATLFTGPATPVVDTGYARFQGKQDQVTQSSNYLG